jgi:hypothetical protein
MVREGAPTMSLFAPAKDVDADLRRHDGRRGRRVGFNGRWCYGWAFTAHHGFCRFQLRQSWVAGPSPAMTFKEKYVRPPLNSAAMTGV